MSQKYYKRCILHPATDLWMSGDRCGEIISETETHYTVRMDKSQRVVTMPREDISETFESKHQQ